MIARNFAALTVPIIFLVIACGSIEKPGSGGSSREIVGGTPVTTPNAFSVSTVALISDTGWYCTAVLIDSSHALTAAHCVVDSEYVFKLIFGMDIRGGLAGKVTRPVTRIKAHEDYVKTDPPQYQYTIHDIAILEFSGGIPAGFSAVPLVDAGSTLIRNDILVALGYGSTGLNQGDGGTLRQVSTLFSRYEVPGYVIRGSLPGKTTCKGDSGGPDYAFFPSLGPVLAGIHSTGDCQSDQRSANVSIHLPWIRANGGMPRTVALLERDITEIPFSDAFSEPSLELSGTLWTVRKGGFDIQSQILRSTVTGGSILTLNGVAERDISLKTKFVGLQSGKRCAELISRYTGPGDNNMYAAMICNNKSSAAAKITAGLYKNVSGNWSTIVTKGIDAVDMGIMRFDTVGSSLKLYLNGSLILTVQDNGITGAGLVGIRSNYVNDTFDDFSATTNIIQPPSFSFSTDFNFPNGNPPNVWSLRQGNLFINSNTLQSGVSGASVLILNTSSPLADVSLSVKFVNLTSGKRCAGLVSRYTGPGDNNFYLAMLCKNSTSSRASLTAALYKNVSGSWTTISSKAVSPISSGTLRFDTVGSSLKLYLNGSLLLDKTDTSIQEPGLVGIRTFYTGSTVDDFSVSSVVP
ncbi:MAG: trypsin-like serine protease [Deltaproteobacteria bacterium]|nr:trypsin-like serine protease [Deltaproteobacteria bacterium]